MAWLFLWLVLAAQDPLAIQGNKALVLLFVRPDCPISNRYAPEIQRLYLTYSPQGVAFRLVYAAPGLTPAAIEQHRRDYGYGIPGVADPDRRYVARAGVRTTPEAAVFVGGQIIYRGRIDDRYVDFGKTRAQPTHHDLEAVLAAIVRGKAVVFHQTRAIGCAIESAP